MKRWPMVLVVLLYGFFFALLQFGEFLLLELFFSSAVLTYLGVTFAWLVGSVVGLLGAWTLPAWGQVLVQLGSLFALSAGLQWLPPLTVLAPVHWFWVSLSGWGVGLFFRRHRNTFPQSHSLFLIENNGFLLGIPTVLLLYAFHGRIGIWSLATGVGLLLLLTAWRWECREAPTSDG